MSAGKGDSPRPYSVSKKIYDEHYDNIKWNSKCKCDGNCEKSDHECKCKKEETK